MVTRALAKEPESPASMLPLECVIGEGKQRVAIHK